MRDKQTRSAAMQQVSVYLQELSSGFELGYGDTNIMDARETVKNIVTDIREERIQQPKVRLRMAGG